MPRSLDPTSFPKESTDAIVRSGFTARADDDHLFGQTAEWVAAPLNPATESLAPEAEHVALKPRVCGRVIRATVIGSAVGCHLGRIGLTRTGREMAIGLG
jgi:hypothetical protein